ncbi:hypothetical protein IW262DRAFT_184865 [Armillaria fumosa]|nr:hypothetical protein IW262DRAFT_184865 [Armillaria fumosa]
MVAKNTHNDAAHPLSAYPICFLLVFSHNVSIAADIFPYLVFAGVAREPCQRTLGIAQSRSNIPNLLTLHSPLAIIQINEQSFSTCRDDSPFCELVGTDPQLVWSSSILLSCSFHTSGNTTPLIIYRLGQTRMHRPLTRSPLFSSPSRCRPSLRSYFSLTVNNNSNPS